MPHQIYIRRVGTKTDIKTRPLKVVFGTVKEKKNFANLKVLKGEQTSKQKQNPQQTYDRNR